MIKDKVVLVTGGNRGIGLAIARALRPHNQVIIASRRFEDAKDNLPELTPGEWLPLHLEAPASVIKTATQYTQRFDKLDLLINNAGVFTAPAVLTEAGLEPHFAINYLGHFVLTLALTNALNSAGDARIVNIASSAHRWAKLDLAAARKVSPNQPWRTYGMSKLATLLFTLEFNRRKPDTAIATACNPGYCATDLPKQLPLAGLGERLLAHSPEAGAKIALAAATAEAGSYFTPGGWLGLAGEPTLSLPARAATEVDTAAELWDWSLDFVRSHFADSSWPG